MNVLKSIMCAMAMLLLSTSFVFSQSIADRSLSTETATSIEISIVNVAERRTNSIVVPLIAIDSPLTVEILNQEGIAIVNQVATGSFVRIAVLGAPNAYTLNVYQGDVLILTTPYPLF